MMQDLVGITRTGAELSKAVDAITELKDEALRVGCGGNREFNPGWHTALELPHMLTVAEAITRAALARRESRGGHFREDFPDKDENLGNVNMCIAKGLSGEMHVSEMSRTPMRADLQDIVREMK
jgi:succinate dehydrogenase / fumarate reductase flavoprotein subunit